MSVMTERSATHSTFVIERVFPVPPARVYRAFADPTEKAKWFAGGSDQMTVTRREEDFRVGGHARSTGQWHNGPESDFQCTYLDIVPNQRIIFSYDMHLDGVRISVSLTTVEFRAADDGTRLIHTEQGVYLDGYDDAGKREEGTRVLIEALGKTLA
jgi:uncharacterized protein YndB with AHSA1/START domain